MVQQHPSMARLLPTRLCICLLTTSAPYVWAARDLWPYSSPRVLCVPVALLMSDCVRALRVWFSGAPGLPAPVRSRVYGLVVRIR